MIWPECDPQRQNIFQKVCDSLFYPYVNRTLDKGSKLHKERLKHQEIVDSRHDNIEEDVSLSASASAPAPVEMTQEDLFEAPPYMQADVLQERFRILFEKKNRENLEKQKKKGKLDANSRRKARRWALIQVLWKISQPTYIYAGGYQLVTVLAQALNPLAVQGLLKLFEKYPNQEIFAKGIGFAIFLFLLSVVDGIAQERHKFLSFQSGILIRAATVTSIYHHMLNLSSKGKQNLLTGETMNLVAIDCQKLFEVCQEGHLLWSCPLSMVIVTVLLLVTLGPSTLVGMLSMFLLVPIVKKVVERMMLIRRKRAVHTDKRVDITTAMLQSIKFCKLNHYEEKFLKRVNDVRKEELVWVRKELMYLGITLCVTVLTPVIACALTYITYALWGDGNTLSASETFTTLVLFAVLRFPINYAGKLMGKAAQGLEACQRIADFFDREATKDNEFGDKVAFDTHNKQDDDVLVQVIGGSFTVGKAQELLGDDTNDSESGQCDSGSESKAAFTLSGVNFSVKRSETFAVVGPVASGKSTLLQALIGDVESNASDMKIRGSVAYASQNPFILNATIRQNILFGRKFDKDLYDKVLEACNLGPDLHQVGPAKDLTQIGERGVTLSGGQKARLSLARCVYAQPDVALFDDVLSALDAATGKLIFERLFDSTGERESLLSKSAVVLVTHAAHFLSRVDNILVLLKGKSIFTGNWDELLSANPQDPAAFELISSICSSVQESDDSEGENVLSEKSTKVEDGTKESKSGIIMTEEEREFGLSEWKTWVKWFRYAGGCTFITCTLIFLYLDRGAYVITELWLATWTAAVSEPVERFGFVFAAQSDGLSAQYEFIKVYVIILLISFVSTFVRGLYIIQGGARCSEKLFNEMTTRTIYAPMSYFETTPIGRILNRLTYDVETLDITLSYSMTFLIIASGWFVIGIVLQIAILPWVACVLFPILLVFLLLLRYYRKSAVDLQRLDAVSRSPIQANLAEGIDGSSTIRVFGMSTTFENQFKKCLDYNTSAMMNFMAAQRWLGVRFQCLGSFCVLFATTFAVSNNDSLKLDPGLIAILIIWSSNLTITLSFFSVAVSEAEANITSVERATDLAEVAQEGAHHTEENKKPSAEWPSNGSLSFEKVCLRYRPGLPLALKGLTFTAEPGQRVGICGRTGAGKSTISVALFRLAELESGKIILDGHDLSELGLGDVRGRKNGMAIIPQDPTLFSGPLRECLDPWGQSSDKEILDALISVKVADAENRGMEALDDYVDEGGRNFSVGERQLLCLARAVLSKPKVLVLDEATASVDADTDRFIQKMIRSKFKGTTLLTIAHRLNTIMDYDVVMVLDQGNVAEFGSPKELLENEEGHFSALVQSTGTESSLVLREMANNAQNSRFDSSKK